MGFWEAINLFFNGTEPSSTVLALEEYEAGVSMMSILSAFSIIGIIIISVLFILTLINKNLEGKKKFFVSISLVAVLILFIFNLITVNNALESIVADIIKNYPNAGYHL